MLRETLKNTASMQYFMIVEILCNSMIVEIQKIMWNGWENGALSGLKNIHEGRLRTNSVKGTYMKY